MTTKYLKSVTLFLAAFVASMAQASEDVPQIRDTAVWVQPLAPVLLAFNQTLYVPVGAYVPLGDLGTFTVEASVTAAQAGAGGWERNGPYWQAGLAVGRLFKLTDRDSRSLSGFFLQPKLQVLVSSEAEGQTTIDHPTLSGARTTSYEFQAAADFGYQRVFGAFFIGAAIGAGLGYGTGLTSTSPLSAALSPSLFGRASPTNHVVVSVNLNLLRISFAF